MTQMPRSLEDLKTLLGAQKWEDRTGVKAEYDAAIKYIDADMHVDVETLLAERYPATQRDPEGSNRMVGVAVALVQQYCDEMASAYTGTVERKIVDDNGKEDKEVTDAVLAEMERTGHDQVMQALDRRVVLVRSCGLDIGVEAGHVNPVIYPPQDVYPVKPLGRVIDPACYDSHLGFVVDRHTKADSFGGEAYREYTLLEADQYTDYMGASAGNPKDVTGGKPNSITGKADKLDASGRYQGTEERPLQPLVMFHAHKPVGQLVPLGSVPLFNANRWMNVLWTVILDVVRFQAGATLTLNSSDPQSLDPYRAVGVRHPIVLDANLQQTASYMGAGNDYAGLGNILSVFARTLGMSLRMSGDDLSIERTAESGIARQIANLPKERARQERVRWYTQVEANYVWPRYAACMIWLNRLNSRARNLHMVTTLKPAPMPVNRVETIQIEAHDLTNGLTTRARILADREKISVEDARAKLKAMREEEAEDAVGEDSAPTGPVDAGKASGVAELVKSVVMGDIPADSARAMLVSLYGLTAEDADEILSPVVAEKEAEEKRKAEKAAQMAEQGPPQPQPGQPPQGPPQPPKQEAKVDPRKALLEKLATAKKQPEERQDVAE